MLVRASGAIGLGGVLLAACLVADLSAQCVAPPADMLAWYPFDTTEGPVVPELLFAHPGQFAFSPDSTDGIVDGAMLLNDGSDLFERVLVPDHPDLDPGTGDFSVDAWIRVDELSFSGNNSSIVTKMRSDEGPGLSCTSPPLQPGYDFGVLPVGTTDFRLYLLLWDLSSATVSEYFSTTTIPVGAWAHVAVTVDRDTAVRFYVDGALTDTIPLDPAFVADLQSDYPLTIGGYVCNQLLLQYSYFNGAIDELEIFRRVVGQAELAAIVAAGPDGKCKSPCVGPPTSMQAWYTFDEVTGSVSHDYFGEHHGQHEGAPQPAPGVVAGALDLNQPAAFERVLVPDHPDLDFGLDDFTLDAWIYPATPTGVSSWTSGSIAMKLRDPLELICGTSALQPGYDFGVLLHDAGHVRLYLLLWEVGPTVTLFESTLPIPRDAWSHVAVRVERDVSVGFFVDGVPVDQFPLGVGSSAPLENDYPLIIGGASCQTVTINYAQFVGRIDELELFRRALAPEEILGVYASGPGGKCRTDCNGNGVDDAVDLATGTSVDRFGALVTLSDGTTTFGPNGIPDECDTQYVRRILEEETGEVTFRPN